MLYLLLGPDDFSKREYVQSLAIQNKAEIMVFSNEENLPQVEELGGQDLFAKPKIFVLKGLIKHYQDQPILEKLIVSKNYIVLEEEKLDKRLSETKKLLANPKILQKEFNLPHGLQLNKWIEERVKALGGKISQGAVEMLAIALGRDDAKETKFGGKVVEVLEVYSLWQADSEIKKLIAKAWGREILEADVKELVSQGEQVDMFELTNAIGDNNKEKALFLMHHFLKAQVGGDEKASVIQLNALLSEQFRNVAMVQEFLASKKSEDEILTMTGWKSGRLFVMKKIAKNFPAKKISDSLNKLAALDEELKTSQTPPKVLLDLIVAQLLI